MIILCETRLTNTSVEGVPKLCPLGKWPAGRGGTTEEVVPGPGALLLWAQVGHSPEDCRKFTKPNSRRLRPETSPGPHLGGTDSAQQERVRWRHGRGWQSCRGLGALRSPYTFSVVFSL